MSDQALRSKIIRLAHQRPTLRPHLLPLLAKAAAGPYDYDEGIERFRKVARESFIRYMGAMEDLQLQLEALSKVSGSSPYVRDAIAECEKVRSGFRNIYRNFADLNSYVDEILGYRQM